MGLIQNNEYRLATGLHPSELVQTDGRHDPSQKDYEDNKLIHSFIALT